MRVAVIGAGPIGLAAALGALDRGHQVTVLEAGAPGEHLRRWGTTRLFTPLGMSVPAAMLTRLSSAPPAEALLTGPELADRVLVPLARLLGDRLRHGHRVRAVGRARLHRSELAHHPLRAERPFRLLVETRAGELVLEADRVLDASGVYGQPLPMGAGGPARGERALAGRILRDLGAVALNSVRLANRRVLLVGHGHSAANALGALAELVAAHPDTRVIWAVRSSNLRPCVEVASDPLPERRMVTARANELASRPPAWLTVERRAHVEAVELTDDDALAVTLAGDRRRVVDEIVSLTGYRPDLEMLSELALEIGPSNEGVAGLERALANVTDCLTVPAVSPRDLATGEPGFHLIGQKSYGRARTFLLQTGYAQLESILDTLNVR